MRKVLQAPVLAIFLPAVLLGQEHGVPLRQVATIPLPNVEGRIDHFGIDVRGRRLFMSALGNNTVEVFDLKTNQRLHTITGLDEPQGVTYAPDSNKIFVANGGDGAVSIFDGETYNLVSVVHLSSDADDTRYDAASRRVYVGYGEGGIAELDSNTGQLLGETKLEGHPEAFEVGKGIGKIFINVPTAREIAVADAGRRAIVARWRLAGYGANFPMALDEAGHRLFVVSRRPAQLLVFDTESSQLAAHLAAVGDSDDVWYDAARKRIYASGGEGFISVFEQTDAGHYRALANLPTAPGARTSFFSPDLKRLFLAVPHHGAQKCELRIFETVN